jgi:hypothetical protein
MPKRSIVLAKSDNVAMVTADLRPGTDVLANAAVIAVQEPIPFGHKIALSAIAPGADIIKFGVSIGRATTSIAAGEHVHVHNIESVYINNAVDHYEA